MSKDKTFRMVVDDYYGLNTDSKSWFDRTRRDLYVNAVCVDNHLPNPSDLKAGATIELRPLRAIFIAAGFPKDALPILDDLLSVENGYHMFRASRGPEHKVTCPDLTPEDVSTLNLLAERLKSSLSRLEAHFADENRRPWTKHLDNLSDRLRITSCTDAQGGHLHKWHMMMTRRLTLGLTALLQWTERRQKKKTTQ